MIAKIVEISEPPVFNPLLNDVQAATVRFDLSLPNMTARGTLQLLDGSAMVAKFTFLLKTAEGQPLKFGEQTDRLEMRWSAVATSAEELLGATVRFYS